MEEFSWFDQVKTESLKTVFGIAKDLVVERLKKRESKKLDEDGKSLSFLKLEDLINDNINLPEVGVVDDAIKEHLTLVKDWSNEVYVNSFKGPKKLGKIYVELDSFLIPSSEHQALADKENKVKLIDTINNAERHVVILGQPGSGKTTSMKKLCGELLNSQIKSKHFPVLIRFRHLYSRGGETTIISELDRILGINAKATLSAIESNEDDVNSYIFSIIDGLKPIIILEGFDEIPTDDNKASGLDEIRLLIERLKKAKVIVTCRTGQFNHRFDHSEVFEIAHLSSKQVETFATNWLGKLEAENFVLKVEASPFSDTSIKPLSLAHLCAIYERTKNIPEKPKLVYRKVINLMLEDWDEQRFVNRSKSRYSNFEVSRKFDFLCSLAFYITTEFNTTVFSRDQLEDAYRAICLEFSLPIHDSRNVASELESHTGLLLQSGFEQFEFAHKSLQEFLTAEYIVRLIYPNEIHKHLESLAAELAIAVGLSSRPGSYLNVLVNEVFKEKKLTQDFFYTFGHRLILECPDFKFEEQLVISLFTLLGKMPFEQKLYFFISQLIKGKTLAFLFESYYIQSDCPEGLLVLQSIKPVRRHINTEPITLRKSFVVSFFSEAIKGTPAEAFIGNKV